LFKGVSRIHKDKTIYVCEKIIEAKKHELEDCKMIFILKGGLNIVDAGMKGWKERMN
jgi:hypothetical protein